MATTKASKSDATQTQLKEDSNAPRDYIMLIEKRILGRWREKDEVIPLTPSQAEYFLRNKVLKLKVASK